MSPKLPLTNDPSIPPTATPSIDTAFGMPSGEAAKMVFAGLPTLHAFPPGFAESTEPPVPRAVDATRVQMRTLVRNFPGQVFRDDCVLESMPMNNESFHTAQTSHSDSTRLLSPPLSPYIGKNTGGGYFEPSPYSKFLSVSSLGYG